MKRDLLKTCIDALVELRARKQHVLEASVVSELDAVILQLESCLKSGTVGAVQVPDDLRMRTLSLIVECLMLATNLSELIHRFFGPE